MWEASLESILSAFGCNWCDILPDMAKEAAHGCVKNTLPKAKQRQIWFIARFQSTIYVSYIKQYVVTQTPESFKVIFYIFFKFVVLTNFTEGFQNESCLF